MLELESKIEEHGRLFIVRLKGSFYIDNIKLVNKLWNEILVKKPEVIAIDCRELDFIDSSAIGTLVRFLNTSVESEVKIIFYDLSDSIVSIFSTAKLIKIFPIMSKDDFDRQYLNKKS